jgi:hypothetical protein
LSKNPSAIQKRKCQSKNLEKIIQKEEKRHKDHICDLQLKQSVKCLFNVTSGRDSTQRIKQRDIKNQGKYSRFCRHIKLSAPERSG